MKYGAKPRQIFLGLIVGGKRFSETGRLRGHRVPVRLITPDFKDTKEKLLERVRSCVCLLLALFAFRFSHGTGEDSGEARGGDEEKGDVAARGLSC